jgi:hypothetical protein
MRVGLVKLNANTLALVGAGVLAFMAFRRQIASAASEAATSIAQGIAETAGNIIIGAGTGTVIGIGKAVGIPETDAAQCQAAIDAGEFWRASAYCPAGTFIQNSWGLIFDPVSGEQIGSTRATGSPAIIEIEPAPLGQISDWPAA